MKYLRSFVLFVGLLCGVFSVKLSPNPFSLDKSDTELFQEFQNKFNFNFAKSTEKNQRFNIFQDNLVKIRALNAENNGAQFGINAFSALTPDEFKQRLLSDEFMQPINAQNATHEDINNLGDWWQHDSHRATRDAYPINFDWRTQNVISSIKDQGSCGSCWAFASVAAVETHYAIKNGGAKVELSEQELVDCDKRSYGCQGGFMYEALEYIRDKGLHSRTNYPYTGWNDQCKSNMTGTKIKTADALYVLPNNEEDVKKFVYNKGPVIMGFVFPYTLQYYVSGIFSLTWEECRSQRNGNHAMTIVGYGEENGKKFWIAKNSWGSWWGENGFVRFERDIQFCGMISNFYCHAPSFDPPTTTTSTTTTTTPIPTTTTTTIATTTTVKPVPSATLNCSGAMDLVFVIDVSDFMTPERLEIVKSQLLTSIDQNGIKWQSNDINTARIGIILSSSFFFFGKPSPLRYVDFKGFVDNIYGVPRTITFNAHFKQAIRDIPFYSGVNDIGFSMNLSLHGDSPDWYFGYPLFGGEGDRPNVPNAMIVISGGTNTTNVGVSTRQLRDAGVQVYSIGFDDLTISQLQEISGNPQTAFSTTPENLANTIKQICTTTLSTPTTTPATTVPTTTVKPSPVPRLNCSGAMDLVFVIDVSDFMTPERLEIVKSQLLTSIDQNGIKWQSNDINTARIGIILSSSFFFFGKPSPLRYVDFKGFVDNIYGVPRTITFNAHFKQAIRDIPFYSGVNDIGFSMNLSLHGDSPDWYFGYPLFGGEGDRPNVPNAMIVISGGTNTTNVGVSTRQLRDAGVQVYSIGFDDLTISQLQEISGNPQTAFSTTPENLANTIKQICTTTLSTPTTTPATTVPTTTVKPSPVPRLNCSGAMDLVFVIDVSDFMTPERLEIVKSQLLISIDQNGIKWQSNDINTARIGIILSSSFFFYGKPSPLRYVDFNGFVDNIYGVPRTITFNAHFKQAIRDIPFYSGVNDIGFSMNLSLHGDSPDWYFGYPLFGGEGDRPNVPNAMIVISGGTNTTNVGVSTRQLRDAGVQVYSIGFDDLTISQLQEISANPQTAFSTTPENLANTIKQICTGV